MGVVPTGAPATRSVAVPAAQALRPSESATAERGRAAQSLLLGSGVELRQLLLDGDRLLERAPQSRVELTIRLEAARGALVQNQPAEVLALLDESWETAQHTEQGWYLRGSALAALGLPGEALRVAQEALRLRPRSRALQFIGSLARLLVGDTPGARALVEQALADAPDDPLLLAHSAVIASRSGLRETASDRVQQAAAKFPDHPAVQYARAWIASDRASASRSSAREATTNESLEISDWEGWSNVESDAAVHTDDPIESMFRDVGRSLRTPSHHEDVVSNARRLLQALSSGGALASTANAERMHAARTLLSTISTVWSGGDHPVMQDSNGVPRAPHRFEARSVIVPLLELLRTGKQEAVLRSVQHSAMQLPPPMRGLLVALFEEAARPVAARTSGNLAAVTPDHAAVFTDRSRDEASRGVINPLRLGLSLIEENSAAAAASAHVVQRAYSTTAGMRAIPDIVELQSQAARQHYATGPLGWDAHPSNTSASQSSRIARVVAVACVLGAIGAMAAGKAVLALALAGGASWFALRRAHRLQDTAEFRTAERSIQDASR